MRIFITGATGTIGRRLVADRLDKGDDLVVLSRNAARARATLEADGARVEIVEGDAVEPGVWQNHVDGCDAVVHLAGAGVADKRWTAAYKRTLVDSRVAGTLRVVEAIDAARQGAGVLVNASAVGYYGETGDRAADETAPPGDDFLADLAVEWERQARAAETHGARAVMLRTGVVLDPRGGALAGLLPIFRLLLGGRLGSGRQYMPWIHWRDVTGLIGLALRDQTLTGPLNVVAPESVTNRRFTAALAAALHRPAVLPMPGFALRLAIGELGRFALMSQRITPAKALEHGYEFAHPQIEEALESLVAE